ncbi:hypothetical protein EVAR_45298_1 [Eumeta japonica]|uniref:Uncharacterized protein n=1 Tax=Eumeta variegata TaxID=151549 RepID=A0A4C1Y9G1_EUMVA|nr:hypothetical protein EVAR_45298_1 [Eumeta japonica]
MTFFDRRCWTDDLFVAYARASSRRGYDPDESSGYVPISGVQTVKFPKSRRCRGGVSGFTVIFFDRHVWLWECTMKWWVAAPFGLEKLDDGEPQRSGKTTTITHLT